MTRFTKQEFVGNTDRIILLIREEIVIDYQICKSGGGKLVEQDGGFLSLRRSVSRVLNESGDEASFLGNTYLIQGSLCYVCVPAHVITLRKCGSECNNYGVAVSQEAGQPGPPSGGSRY